MNWDARYAMYQQFKAVADSLLVHSISGCLQATMIYWGLIVFLLILFGCLFQVRYHLLKMFNSVYNKDFSCDKFYWLCIISLEEVANYNKQYINKQL